MIDDFRYIGEAAKLFWGIVTAIILLLIAGMVLLAIAFIVFSNP